MLESVQHLYFVPTISIARVSSPGIPEVPSVISARLFLQYAVRHIHSLQAFIVGDCLRIYPSRQPEWSPTNQITSESAMPELPTTCSASRRSGSLRPEVEWPQLEAAALRRPRSESRGSRRFCVLILHNYCTYFINMR